MKVRIKPVRGYCQTSFLVQQKKWYGWKTIHITYVLPYALTFVKDLNQIADVEFIKM